MRNLDLDRVIGLLLRYGVLASFVTICVGTLLLFASGQTGYYPVGNSANLLVMPDRFLTGPGSLVGGIQSMKPYAVIDLGLLILLATPITRVIVSAILFFGEKRYSFVVITMTVLSLLLFGIFVVGPLVAG